MTTPQNEQAGAFIPILMILLGAALIGIGWVVNDPTGEIQNSIGDVIQDLFNPTITVENPEQIEKVSNPATATTLVIVLPNDNEPPVAAHAPVMPVAAPAPAMPVAAPAAQADGNRVQEGTIGTIKMRIFTDAYRPQICYHRVRAWGSPLFPGLST